MSIYRGAGGASDATDDSTVNAVAGYASAAASSASSAATSATNASNSATAAASSASSAASSASSVATNASNAASSAGLANTYATAASASKDAAAASATTASTKAGEASTSASNAAASASTAATKATTAAINAADAASSSYSASTYASNAASSAASALAIYGNTTAMNNAVAAAATSATNADTSADAAYDAQILAEAAVTGASLYADAAQASANSAQASATSAASAAATAAANAVTAAESELTGYVNAALAYSEASEAFKDSALAAASDANIYATNAGASASDAADSALEAANSAAAAAAVSGSGNGTFVNTPITTNSTITLSSGTANGVAYLNGSKVLTTGSGLVFNGTNLGIGTTSPLLRFDAGVALSAGTIQDVAIFHQVSGADPTTGQGARIYLAAHSNTSRAAAIQALVTDGLNGHSLQFLTQQGGNTPAVRATIDAVGNLGLGVTPSAWTSSVRALETTTGAFYSYASGTTSNFYMLTNAYFNGTNNIYKASNFATQYLQSAGQHIWYNAPSGTAGNVITFTQAMTLDASGRLAIGATSASNTLDVAASGGATFRVYDSADVGRGLVISAGSAASGVSTIQTNTSVRVLAFGTNSTERMRLDSSGNLLVGLTSATGVAKLQVSGPLRTTGYTVATLPAGTVGMRTYVTDALAPVALMTVAGGGAVTVPVFYNGSNWIVA